MSDPTQKPTTDPSAPWYRTALHPDTLHVGDLVLAAFPYRYYTEWRLGIVRQLEHLTDPTDLRGVQTTHVSHSQPFVAQIDSYPDASRTPFSTWFSGADVQPYAPAPTDEELDARLAWESLS